VELDSLTPCFSWVRERCHAKNRFNGFLHTVETVETVPSRFHPHGTQLKQGVNEKRAAKLASGHGLRAKGAKVPFME
jgi:hypothetical protein